MSAENVINAIMAQYPKLDRFMAELCVTENLNIEVDNKEPQQECESPERSSSPASR